MEYLQGEKFEVKWVKTEDTSIKDSLGIPQNLRSCHTMKIGDYFVEGHVPVEVVRKLLREKPAIKGIALPGMPSGSPGMGGPKTETFVIYSIGASGVAEYIRL